MCYNILINERLFLFNNGDRIMFNTFNDGKSFNIQFGELPIYQSQANMLVRLLDKKLDAKYMLQIESIEAYDNQGFCINLGGPAANKEDVYTDELGEAVWNAGESLFIKFYDLAEQECSLDTFEPASSSSYDVEEAVNLYIKAHEDLDYNWDWKIIEYHFNCYNDKTINQRVQDYKPVYLFTQETVC